MKRAARWQMRWLIVAGVALVAAAVVIGSRRRTRLHAAPRPSRRATERWEGEGGALGGEPL